MKFRQVLSKQSKQGVIIPPCKICAVDSTVTVQKSNIRKGAQHRDAGQVKQDRQQVPEGHTLADGDFEHTSHPSAPGRWTTYTKIVAQYFCMYRLGRCHGSFGRIASHTIAKAQAKATLLVGWGGVRRQSMPYGMGIYMHCQPFASLPWLLISCNSVPYSLGENPQLVIPVYLLPFCLPRNLFWLSGPRLR